MSAELGQRGQASSITDEVVSNRLALIESGLQGEDAAQQSVLILSALVGALLLSRSVGAPELSDRLLHGARELLIEQANATPRPQHCADKNAPGSAPRALSPAIYL